MGFMNISPWSHWYKWAVNTHFKAQWGVNTQVLLLKLLWSVAAVKQKAHVVEFSHFSDLVCILTPCKERTHNTLLLLSAHFPHPHNISFLSWSVSFSLCPPQYLFLTSFLPLLDNNHLFTQVLREFLCLQQQGGTKKTQVVLAKCYFISVSCKYNHIIRITCMDLFSLRPAVDSKWTFQLCKLTAHTPCCTLKADHIKQPWS